MWGNVYVCVSMGVCVCVCFHVASTGLRKPIPKYVIDFVAVGDIFYYVSLSVIYESQ